MKARVCLHQLEFFAHHGVYADERANGQMFLVDVSFEYDAKAASESDQLDDAIDYVGIYNDVDKEMQRPVNLLEHLVVNIRKRLISRGGIENLKVKVTKINPPLKCKSGGFSVEI